MKFRAPLPGLALVLALRVCSSIWAQTAPPAPYGPVPTPRQLRWHDMEFYGFVHFTVNTFTDKEWGYGDESEQVFNPTDFDADQIARTAKRAGMRGLILTAKHHDGFCLWPSQYTEHSVKNSPWKNGKGDVVKELSEACRRQHLRFGVYLSPWDRNNKNYGRPEYITYYRNQLRELLTHYGDIFTVWFDGANGGDGFYGGARETRKIDASTYYDWEHTRQLVRELMPMAVMFSDAGPDVRWVGNEDGTAGDPCWETLNASGRYPGGRSEGLNSGERPGTDWLPAECDVSIRPGWFYHEKENPRVKTAARLLDIYYKSVGRGACLNLNIPPDRRGQIHAEDVRALEEFHRVLETTFASNLAEGAKLTASNVRGHSKEFAPENLVRGHGKKYWATDDQVTTPELVLEFPHPVSFNVVSLREFLPLGQRVEGFALDKWQDGQWTEFAKATSIGNQRLIRGDLVTAEKIRLRVAQAPVCVALSELGLFLEPRGSEYAGELKEQLSKKVLPYWFETAIDQQNGGYILSDDAGKKAAPATEKQLVTQSRMIWGFSHAHLHGFSDSKHNYLAAAEQGYRFLQAHFLDRTNGGYYWTTDLKGEPLDRRKILYGESFVIYGLVEYFRASGDRTALDQAVQLYHVVQKYSHDAAHGGWIEHFEPDWKPILDPRAQVIVELGGAKSANTHLHLMEALTELYQVTRDSEVRNSLQEALEVNSTYFYPSDPSKCSFHRQPDWQLVTAPSSAGLSYGHNVEFAWLMIQAEKALGRPLSWSHFEAHLNHALQYGYDHQRGGLYSRGFDNQPASDTDKVWWVQAEMLAALTDALKHKENPQYREALDKLLQFVEKYQTTPSDGIWLDTVTAEGKPKVPAKAHNWKANYHDVRAMIKYEEAFSSSR